MADKKLKVGPQIRSMTVASCTVRKADDGTKRFDMTLSSEYPVDRGWGYSEILSHDSGAVRLDRAKAGAMPLLFNHNSDDPVGMVDKASLKDKKLRVEGAFFSTQRAQDVAAMMEGGLRNVSVGYRIHKIEDDLDEETYTATDWEPYEASIAPVPADPTVGIGRSALLLRAAAEFPEIEITVAHRSAADALGPLITAAPGPEVFVPSNHTTPEEGTSMAENTAGAAGNGPAQGAGAAPAGSDATRNATPRVETDLGPSLKERDEGRIQAITNMMEMSNVHDEDMKMRWITAGTSLKDVSDQITTMVRHRNELNKKNIVSNLGLSRAGAQQFSVVRAVLAASTGDWRQAGYEAECSQEISQRLNRIPDAKKFYIPYEVQQRPIDPAAINSPQRALNLGNARPLHQRADVVATTTAGGYLVETINVGFIELLRNRSVAYRMGATQLSGLVGNVNVPKQTAAGTAYWLASETTTITEAEQTFGQMALSPHTVGAYTEISRQLLLQSSPGVEGIVNADLAAVASLAVDEGALVGSGISGQPTGIKNVSGVGTTTGGDMATIAYKGQLEFQTAVASANVVPVRGGYVTTPAVAALLMQRTRFANTATPLWDGNLWDANGPLQAAGFPAMSTNQMPAAAMYFGDWSSLVIAEWGVLEIEVNPYAGFQAGIIGIRAMMTIDVGLRYPAAFCIQGANVT